MSGPRTLHGGIPETPDIQILRDDRFPPRRNNERWTWEGIYERIGGKLMPMAILFIAINWLGLYLWACWDAWKELTQ